MAWRLRAPGSSRVDEIVCVLVDDAARVEEELSASTLRWVSARLTSDRMRSWGAPFWAPIELRRHSHSASPAANPRRPRRRVNGCPDRTLEGLTCPQPPERERERGST